MPRISSIAVCVFLLATSALAQVPKGNVFFGYSYVRTDAFVPSFSSGANLNGWEGSLEGKVFPHVGIVADASAHYGGQDFSFGRVDGSVYNFLFGPQVSVGVGKLTPFAHVLIGAGHVSASSRAASFSTSDTSFADALGGGLDYKLIPAVAWRFQADLLQTRFFSDTQNNFRFSTGIVFRF
ncbi:MAG: porin family protein [Acidobacteriia bacterium]|nr:porin family protein [Terriglobia bacterium]